MQQFADNLITIRDLHFARGDKVIFDGVNFDFLRGQITAVLGPSGTGKTTLLRLIGAQIAPEQGSIHFEDQNIHTLSRKALYHLRFEMGMLFQSGALFTDMDTLTNVAFPLLEHTKLPADIIQQIALMKLEAVGLRGARHLMPGELSGGMARRAALARAIAMDPKLMMYDEPFAGQDPISMGVIVKLIKTLNDALGMTSILVSHDVPETLSIADYVYVISGGKIIGQGTPEEMRDSDIPDVQQFIHGLPDGAVPFHYPAAQDYHADLRQVGE